jgi:hypothetical protein
MKYYMITFTLPELYSPRFISLIPAQREKVGELMKRGLLQNYCVSADRTTAWAVVRASSLKTARDITGTLPLSRYMKPRYNELLFNSNPAFILPEPSLN